MVHCCHHPQLILLLAAENHLLHKSLILFFPQDRLYELLSNLFLRYFPVFWSSAEFYQSLSTTCNLHHMA